MPRVPIKFKLDIQLLIDDYLKRHPLPTEPITETQADHLLFQIHQEVYNALPDEGLGIGAANYKESQVTAEWHYDQIGLLARQLRPRLVIKPSS